MKKYIINIPVFEGPFELLYHLIHKQEIDIWSVSIADITEQYLDYLQLMGELNLEIAGDFLVMAATLLRLKSKLLLPVQDDLPEEEADGILNINSSEELIRRILEYRLYKQPVSFLKEREEEQQRIFFRCSGQPKVLHINHDESFLYEEDLSEILLDLLKRQLIDKAEKEVEYEVVLMEELELKERISVIMSKLRDKKRAVYLDYLFESKIIGEIIVTFIAVLELARQKQIKLMQHKSFGPILVELS